MRGQSSSGLLGDTGPLSRAATDQPEPGRDEHAAPPPRALELLRSREFRRLYLAVATSRLGDAFHYVALMWVALVAGAAERQRVREGLAALAGHPALAVGIAVLGIAVTISAGTWIVGVPELVRTDLGRGAGSFSLVAAAYAAGSIAAGLALTQRHVGRKALGSLLAWALYVPAYGCFAFAGSLGLALAGGALRSSGRCPRRQTLTIPGQRTGEGMPTWRPSGSRIGSTRLSRRAMSSSAATWRSTSRCSGPASPG
jgi:hypothetical protein